MRVRYTAASRKRRKKILQRAKGFKGARGTRLRVAKEALLHAGVYAYRDRKAKKRTIRRLWITRISAFVRANGMSYSRFIEGLTKAKVRVNRKVLANLAIEDTDVMMKYMELAQKNVG